MHFSNCLFSKKETRFPGLWVVWGLLGGAGEKKKENQMFLQNELAEFPKFDKKIQKKIENSEFRKI